MEAQLFSVLAHHHVLVRVSFVPGARPLAAKNSISVLYTKRRQRSTTVDRFIRIVALVLAAAQSKRSVRDIADSRLQ